MSEAETAPTKPVLTGTALYRAKALEQVASPDRIDLAPQVVRPTAWLALLSFALVLLGGLVGSALVRIPVDMLGAGLLMPEATAQPVPADRNGVVTGYPAQIGDQVAKGEAVAQLQPVATVAAPFAGQVVSLDQPIGRPIAPGMPLVTLLPTDGPLDAVLFMRPAQTRTLRAGMPARIAVDSGRPVQLRGHVATIGTRPASAQAIGRQLGNAVLGETLAQAGATVEVRIVLDGPSPPGLAELLCQATITVQTRTVLDMILPEVFSRSAG